MYTIRFLLPLLVAISFSTLSSAQVPVEWKGQAVTIIEDTWYPDGEKGESQFWTRRMIRHDEEGKPLRAELKHRDDGVQKVEFEYNDKGDLVRRVHEMGDSTVLEYTWKYKYDNEGRLTERTNFQGTDKLLSQIVKIYDEKGQLTDHAGYFSKDAGYQAWAFQQDETGERIVDPRFMRFGPRHIYYNWEERIFAEKLDAFSLLPAEDVFQRFHFEYDSVGKMSNSEQFDRSRNLVEKGEYHHTGKWGQVRSIITHNYVDSVSWVWDLHYDSLKRRYRTRLVNVADVKDQKEIFAAEWINENGQLKEYRTKKPGMIHDYYVYNDGKLVIREIRDLFDEILERWTYDEKGRLQEIRTYGSEAKLEVLRTYTYK